MYALLFGYFMSIVLDTKSRVAYTVEEAKKKKVSYKQWNDFPHKTGEWVLTDDGYVVQIIRSYNSPINRDVPARKGYDNYSHKVYSIGVRLFSPINKTFKLFTKTIDRRKWLRGIGSIYMSRADKLFCDLLLFGMDLSNAAKICYPHISYPSIYVKSVLRKNTVRKYMMVKLEEDLIKSGITKEWIAKWYKNFVEDTEMDAKIRLESLRDLAEMQEMRGKKTNYEEYTESRTLKFDSNEIKQLEEEKQQRLLSVKSVSNDDDDDNNGKELSQNKSIDSINGNIVENIGVNEDKGTGYLDNNEGTEEAVFEEHVS